MHRKMKWKRPAQLVLYLASLEPDEPEKARTAEGGDLFAPFTAVIGARGRSDRKPFGLNIATPGALLHQEFSQHDFKGVIVERYVPLEVVAFIEEVLRSVEAVTWPEVEETLKQIMWPKE